LNLNRVAVVSKVGSKESEDAAKKVAKKLLAKKSQVFTISPVEVEGAKKVGDLEVLKDTKLDLTITLGGDGTTLRTFRYLENEVPNLAINVGGNRGILSEITMNEIDTAINQMLSGNIFLDKRIRVVASCNGQDFPPALNEIFINRQNLTKTSLFEIRFQNDTVTQKMDGVIISTPSGSTGHSYSLGGPILHESLDVLIITPVAPVNKLPSLVVSDEKIEILSSHDSNIIMDAQVIKPARNDDIITIRKYKSMQCL